MRLFLYGLPYKRNWGRKKAGATHGIFRLVNCQCGYYRALRLVACLLLTCDKNRVWRRRVLPAPVHIRGHQQDLVVQDPFVLGESYKQ